MARGYLHLRLIIITDIHQIACDLASRSPNVARWTSNFRPERRVQSQADRQAAVFLLGGSVFQRHRHAHTRNPYSN